MKNYLHTEEARNKTHKLVFAEYLRKALKDYTCSVLCVHHITVTQGCEDTEIPSADTVLFDHNFAKAVFGGRWEDCLKRLVLVPAEGREHLLSVMLEEQRILDCSVGMCRSTHVTEVA